MECTKCNGTIPEGRLKALPDTRTCVECSTTHAFYVRNIISGKTEYSETEIIKSPSLARKLRAMDKRTGWGSNLVKV